MKTYKSRARIKRQEEHSKDKYMRLGVLEALIHAHEHTTNPNLMELKRLKRLANEVRNQITVLSR